MHTYKAGAYVSHVPRWPSLAVCGTRLLCASECVCMYVREHFTYVYANISIAHIHKYTYVKTHKHTCIPMLSQTPVQDSAGVRLAGDIHVIFYDYDMLSKPTKMFGFWVT